MIKLKINTQYHKGSIVLQVNNDRAVIKKIKIQDRWWRIWSTDINQIIYIARFKNLVFHFYPSSISDYKDFDERKQEITLVIPDKNCKDALLFTFRYGKLVTITTQNLLSFYEFQGPNKCVLSGFYDSGQIAFQEVFRKHSGKECGYYDTGAKKLIRWFRGGNYSGIWREWNQNGQVTFLREHRNHSEYRVWGLKPYYKNSLFYFNGLTNKLNRWLKIY
jgi:antitoxin component YwqK of YwqJK toxin-antitoxin module